MNLNMIEILTEIMSSLWIFGKTANIGIHPAIESNLFSDQTEPYISVYLEESPGPLVISVSSMAITRSSKIDISKPCCAA